jgi:hypothetical protein
MATHSHLIDDRPSPLAFLMPAALIGGLIWVCMLLLRVSPY